jgi:molybdate transport system regulatory protein
MVDSYTLNGRIWIENSAEKVFGPGRVELLERIQASGSIRQAALQMKMSYKQAWDMINHMNTNFTAPVVISQRGGKGGGNAEVTQHGINAIAQFYALKHKFHVFLEEINQSIVL